MYRSTRMSGSESRHWSMMVAQRCELYQSSKCGMRKGLPGATNRFSLRMLASGPIYERRCKTCIMRMTVSAQRQFQRASGVYSVLGLQ